MKRFTFVLLLATPTLSWAQTTSYQLVGYDNEPRVNKQESQLLDSLLQAQRHGFSFAQKRIAFVYGGSTGRALQPKSIFFAKCVLPWVQDGHPPALLLVPLTATEQQATGGYEAFVVAWAKMFSTRRKAILLKQLARQQAS